MVPAKVYLLKAVTELLALGQDINTVMELAMVLIWQ